MTIKKNNLMDEEWDILIILDACRYDYFSKLYKNYFRGNFEKRMSLGTSTLDWCLKTYIEYYPNVIYVSGNPYINSKMELKGFDGKKHFGKIIDVWESEWDTRLGTVLPNKITDIALELIKKNPDNRFIIHYLQPHAPYISNKYQTNGFTTPNISQNQILTGVRGVHLNKILEIMVNGLGYFLMKIKLFKNEWDLRAALNLPPATPMDAFRRKWGIRSLREAYEANLIIVMEQVSELCNKILDVNSSRNILITSDHGELLGENGNFSHHSGSKKPLLLEVPFLKIKSVVQTEPSTSTSNTIDFEEKKIKTTVGKLKRSKKI